MLLIMRDFGCFGKEGRAFSVFFFLRMRDGECVCVLSSGNYLVSVAANAAANFIDAHGGIRKRCASYRSLRASVRIS